MWDAQGNLNRLAAYESNSSRFGCPMGKGKGKSLQWNIERESNGSESGKFKE